MIRIGLLGASKISRGAVITPSKNNEALKVVCVAARDSDRAKLFANQHAIPSIAGDYRELINRDDIDLIYNALPPSEHATWTIESLRAGKHVLCEKPFAMNSTQASDMVQAARECGKHLIEAYHYRFHPLFLRLLDIVQSGRIGKLVRITAHFNVPIAYSPAELRYNPDLGGGAMMDLGCYPVHWSRTVIGEEPHVVVSSCEWHASGVDQSMSTELEFPGGVSAAIKCSMSEQLNSGLDAELSVWGEDGQVLAINPLAPQEGHELIVKTADGDSSESFTREPTYSFQLDHVVDVLNGRTPAITGGEDAIATMRVIDEAYRVAGRVPG